MIAGRRGRLRVWSSAVTPRWQRRSRVEAGNSVSSASSFLCGSAAIRLCSRATLPTLHPLRQLTSTLSRLLTRSPVSDIVARIDERLSQLAVEQERLPAARAELTDDHRPLCPVTPARLSSSDPARTRGFIGLWADHFEDLNSRDALAALFVPLFPTGRVHRRDRGPRSHARAPAGARSPPPPRRSPPRASARRNTGSPRQTARRRRRRVRSYARDSTFRTSAPRTRFPSAVAQRTPPKGAGRSRSLAPAPRRRSTGRITATAANGQLAPQLSRGPRSGRRGGVVAAFTRQAVAPPRGGRDDAAPRRGSRSRHERVFVAGLHSTRAARRATLAVWLLGQTRRRQARWRRRAPTPVRRRLG